jgi:hypothetical protein
VNLSLTLLETHPYYLQQSKTLEKERDEKLELLSEWREHELTSIENTMQANTKSAHDEYEVCARSVMIVLTFH